MGGPPRVAAQNGQIDRIAKAFGIVVRRNQHDFDIFVGAPKHLKARHQPKCCDGVGRRERDRPDLMFRDDVPRCLAQAL